MITVLIQISELFATLLFPLGQLGRISFLNQQISIYPYEVFMGVALIFLLIKYRLSGFTSYRFSKVLLIFFLSLALSFVITFGSYSSYENGIGALYFLRLFFYTIHFLYLGLHAIKVKTFKSFLSREMIFLIAVIIASSWIQYLLYPNLRNLLYQGWDPHLYRVFSFFFEPYLAGGALGLSLLYLLLRWNPKKQNIRFARLFILFMLFTLIMLTFSRTVYLATLLTATLLFLKRGKPLIVGGILVLFIVLAIIIPKPVGVGVQLFRTFSVETRLSNALEGIKLWKKQPLFGVGYNRIRYKKAELGLASRYGSSHAASNYHSSFITMLTAGGLIGLIFYGAILFSLMKISAASSYYILFLGIISAGDNALLHPFMLFILFRMLIVEMDQSSLV